MKDIIIHQKKCSQKQNNVMRRPISLYEEIQQQMVELGAKLTPFFTDEGERQPPQEVVALGALRQRAAGLREKAQACP